MGPSGLPAWLRALSPHISIRGQWPSRWPSRLGHVATWSGKATAEVAAQHHMAPAPGVPKAAARTRAVRLRGVGPPASAPARWGATGTATATAQTQAPMVEVTGAIEPHRGRFTIRWSDWNAASHPPLKCQHPPGRTPAPQVSTWRCCLDVMRRGRPRCSAGTRRMRGCRS